MAHAVKQLKSILKAHSGRDQAGHVTIRGRGGRQKRMYRTIDWLRDKRDMWGTVETIEYDPNRSANISLIKYEDNEVRYILHPISLNVGDKVISALETPVKPGCAMILKNIPIGVEIHNVELIPGQGAQVIRSAGSAGVIIGKDETHALVKLPSGEVRKISLNSCATIGHLDNENKKHTHIGKAGRNRLLGRRPKVRGVAMHPDSHPHGGGEGRSGQGMHPKTPWGKPAMGKKTRYPQKSSNKLIVKRRK